MAYPVRLPESTHMPFLCNSEGHALLLYCQRESKLVRDRGRLLSHLFTPWKMRFMFPHVPAWGRIATGLPDDIEECSPCLSRDGEKLIVSFIAKIPPNGWSYDNYRFPAGYHLLTIEGQSIDQMGSLACVRQNAPCGFVCGQNFAYGSGGSDFCLEVNGSEKKFRTNLAAIHRISFCADNQSHIVISGIDIVGNLMTIMFDSETESLLGEVRVEGLATYKPAILTQCSRWIVTPDLEQRSSGTYSIRGRTTFELCSCSIDVVRC